MAQENNNLLIVGAGQYGLLALEIAQAMGCFGDIAFLDDSSGASVIGSSRDIGKFPGQFRYGFVAIGNPEVRRRLAESLCSGGYTLATLIHPTAYVSPSAQLQKGCCIEPLAVVQTGAAIGTATFVASGAVVRHNATIGDFCHIDCNAVVETGAVVPAKTKISCNAVFRKEQNS
jgi:UDP-3-O-[3-hydroxymyristoyl] glucosamine N-acyltransferase